MQANGKRKAPAVLECKNVGFHMMREWVEDGEIPLYVQMQVQAQLAVTGWKWGAVAAILGGGKFVFDYVERNEDFIQSLASRVTRFWQNVKNGTPPEPTADDGEALRLLHPKQVEGKTIELPARYAAMDGLIVEYKEQIKTAKESLAFYENQFKAAIGDAEFGVFPDGTRYSYKRQVRKAHQVKESESRVLRRLKA
jgi:predicted phage-related endonuclease